jgi:hypothetical protein
MKITLIYFIISLCVATNSFAQKLVRSSFSTFGNTAHDNGTLFRQTIGQPSSTSVFGDGKTLLRQGFQQPVLSLNTNSSKEKECTLYLNPNPASDIVRIKLSEEIGENQITLFDVRGKIHFTINTADAYYEMDVGKLAKGVYIVNVISKSGYQCNQKLIIL